MSQPELLSYPSCDGKHTIHAQQWSPETEIRGVVQIVHGVAEYVGRYAPVAHFLNAHGILVCGEDHLGHGKTVDDGKYGFFAAENGWDLVVRDVRQLRERQGARYPHVPYFMLGHSMGSFLTRTYLIRYPGTVDGAILSGTGHKSALLATLAKGLAGLECLRLGDGGVSPVLDGLSLGAYNKKFKPNRTSADWISRDQSVVDAYLHDPLCTFQPTASMFRDMMGALQEIGSAKNLARMDQSTPIYFFSGDHDPVGDMGKGVEQVADLFRRAGCADVSMRLYSQGRHEMLNELEREQVMEDLLDWLENRL